MYVKHFRLTILYDFKNRRTLRAIDKWKVFCGKLLRARPQKRRTFARPFRDISAVGFANLRAAMLTFMRGTQYFSKFLQESGRYHIGA